MFSLAALRNFADPFQSMAMTSKKFAIERRWSINGRKFNVIEAFTHTCDHLISRIDFPRSPVDAGGATTAAACGPWLGHRDLRDPRGPISWARISDSETSVELREMNF